MLSECQHKRFSADTYIGMLLQNFASEIVPGHLLRFFKNMTYSIFFNFAGLLSWAPDVLTKSKTVEDLHRLLKYYCRQQDDFRVALK